MTDKYFYWLSSQAARDATLWKLALLALGLVAAWELLRYVPPGVARWLRPLYLAGGLALYLGGIALVYLKTGGHS